MSRDAEHRIRFSFQCFLVFAGSCVICQSVPDAVVLSHVQCMNRCCLMFWISVCCFFPDCFDNIYFYFRDSMICFILL